MKRAFAAAIFASVACTSSSEDPAGRPAAEPVVVEVSGPGDCSTRLTTAASHPFLAEFHRHITVSCGGARAVLDLQPDPGGLGRIELVVMEDGLLAITDAFQSATVRLGDTVLVDAGLHAGKWDRYATPCVRTQLFGRAQGVFLGAFDYCDHRWLFLPPL